MDFSIIVSNFAGDTAVSPAFINPKIGTDMKRIYFFVFLLLSVITSIAQNKRLTKITLTASNSEESATLAYDSEGRVSEIQLNRNNGSSSMITLSYEGTDMIKMAHTYSKGTDTYTYTLSNGMIQTEEIFLDYDMVNITNTYEYTGSTLASISTSQTNKGKTKTMKHEFSWSEGSIVEDKFYYQDELETLSTCTPSVVSVHPLLRVLFGTGDGYPRYVTDDMMPLLATYQYMGTIPEKPWSQVDLYDYYDSKSTVYHYDYVLNDDGDVTQVKVTKEGASSSSERTYTLEWEGSSTTPDTPPSSLDITPTDTGKQDFGDGGGIDGNTNLNGNVVDNVYYNIASGDGGYNAFEGCIEITKPTDDSAIEGKDIFGEDFRNHFTGIVLKVAAGKGTIKVNAQTSGSMMIKVRVGSNDPYEMVLNGKVEAKFPYNVTEPTYVYIYASNFTGAAPVRAAAAGGDVLRIYGISWDDSTGIDELHATTDKDAAPVYSLSGQRLKAPHKGINIVGGKKVVMK